MIETELHFFLKSDPTLASMVGDRIFPVTLPQGASSLEYPAITFLRIGANRVRSTEGPSGLSDAHVQIDIWGHDYIKVWEVADRVRRLMDTRPLVFKTRVVQAAFIDSDRDLYEDESRLYRVSQDWTIWWQEA